MRMIKKVCIYCLLVAGLVDFAHAQNVAIGAGTASNAKLEVHGMVGNTPAIFGAGGNGIGLMAGSPGVGFNTYYSSGHRYIGNGYAASLYLDAGTGVMGYRMFPSGLKDALAPGGKTPLRIANNGRVAMGDVTGFDAQLDVGRDAGREATAFFSAPNWSAFNYGTAEHTYLRSPVGAGSLYLNYQGANTKIQFGGGGSLLGINWGNPVLPLEIHHPNFGLAIMRVGSANHWIISTSLRYLKLFFRPQTIDHAITQLGVFDFTTGNYSSSSDARLKKDISPLPPMLSKLMQLKACQYEMIYHNPNHDHTFGFIAQEVKTLFPGLVHVTKDANTGYKDIPDVHIVNYTGFAAIVMKALQEQQAQLTTLEARIRQQEVKNNNSLQDTIGER